jgi:hypothetical protein
MTPSTLTSFISLFAQHKCVIAENFNEVKVLLESDSYNSIDTGAFEQALAFLNKRDALSLSVIIGDNDPIDFYSDNSVPEFVSGLSQAMDNHDDELITVTITLTKKQVDGLISVYDLQSFLAFLKRLSLENLLSQFNDFLKQTSFLLLEQQQRGPAIKTKTIALCNKGDGAKGNSIERDKIIGKARTVGFSPFFTKYQLVPEDFILEIFSNHPLARLFARVGLICSAAYLFDQLTVEIGSISYKLNGYKTVQGIADFSVLAPDVNRQLEMIYTWVYNAPNFNDRLGLARNIISLHLAPEGQLECNGSPYTALSSAYKVYEKENIRQYVTIRNNLSEQILKVHDRANALADTFASGLQKNGLALITFYISVIVLKVVSKDHLLNVFTLDTSIFSTVIIICSFLYFWFSRWELLTQKKRFAEQYFELKRRNLDLLDMQDIKRILNDDREYIQDLEFIKTKLRNYSFMWVCFLMLMFISTWFLFFWYN